MSAYPLNKSFTHMIFLSDCLYMIFRIHSSWLLVLRALPEWTKHPWGVACARQVFMPVTENIRHTCWAPAPATNRMIVEKPFGKDSASSAALSDHLGKLYQEKELYRTQETWLRCCWFLLVHSGVILCSCVSDSIRCVCWVRGIGDRFNWTFAVACAWVTNFSRKALLISTN